MKQLACCGIESKNDWCDLKRQNETTPCEIPFSCVYSYNPTTVYYETGCFRRMNFIISQSAMLIATGATTVAFVQVSYMTIELYSIKLSV